MDNDKQSPNDTENSGAMEPTQQAIFTPDSASQPVLPSAQSQSVFTGSVVEPASTGSSHPYVSIHPTQTFSSEMGDIVVGENTPRSKNKKSIIIIGAIVAAILPTIVTIMIFLSIKTINPITKSENSFYEFANYILYGQKQDKRLIGEYNSNSSYELDKQFFNKNIEFLSEAAMLLSGAIEDYTAVDSAEGLLPRMQDIYDDLEFLITSLEIKEPNEDDIVRVFLQSGNDATQAYLVRFYEPLWGMRSTEAQQYAVQRYEQYSVMSEMLQIYLEHGCVSNEMVDMSCPFSSNTERVSQLINIINSNERTAVTIVPNLLKTIESSCWQVSYAFQNINNIGNEVHEE